MGFCEIEGCENSARYCIEWYGVNQFGENPYLVDELNVCEHHLVEGSVHENYGGAPDNIVDLESDEDKPELLEEVVRKLKE